MKVHTLVIITQTLRRSQSTQHPSLLHAPNLSFHSCLYFSHHSSSQVDKVSPHRMILYRSCSSGVHATPCISPFVTMPRLRRPCREAAARSGRSNKARAEVLIVPGDGFLKPAKSRGVS